MAVFDAVTGWKRQGAVIFIVGLIFAALGGLGVLIAGQPTHPDWFDLIGLIDVSWQVMVGGAFGILFGGGMMAWYLFRPGNPPRNPNEQNRRKNSNE